MCEDVYIPEGWTEIQAIEDSLAGYDEDGEVLRDQLAAHEQEAEKLRVRLAALRLEAGE